MWNKIQNDQTDLNKALSNQNQKKLIIGGYWPLPTELNLVPILKFLHEKSFQICLPVVVG